ncbi:MAG: FkbM family methyltransferase [Phenylobacterium sp.]
MTTPPTTKPVQTRHGTMLAIAGDQYITRSLELYGEFSGAEWDVLEQIVKPGMTVVEVGANIGAHAIPLARRCFPGPLYLFEPQQRIFQVLCANLVLNGVRNAIAYPDAAGAEHGYVMLPPIDYAAAANFGGVSVQPYEEEAGGLRVRVTPLDSLALSACHLLQVDVEGFEAEVLRGAARTIARFRPVLYVENDRREKQAELISLIASMGYRLYWHLPPLFRPENFNGCQENVFGEIVSLNMLCLPQESGTVVKDIELIDPGNWSHPLRRTAKD